MTLWRGTAIAVPLIVITFWGQLMISSPSVRILVHDMTVYLEDEGNIVVEARKGHVGPDERIEWSSSDKDMLDYRPMDTEPTGSRVELPDDIEAATLYPQKPGIAWFCINLKKGEETLRQHCIRVVVRRKPNATSD